MWQSLHLFAALIWHISRGQLLATSAVSTRSQPRFLIIALIWHMAAKSVFKRLPFKLSWSFTIAIRLSANSLYLATSLLTRHPAPVLTRHPAPVLTRHPAPVLTRHPAPVLTRHPAPVLTRHPAPVLTRHPALVLTPHPAIDKRSARDLWDLR